MLSALIKKTILCTRGLLLFAATLAIPAFAQTTIPSTDPAPKYTGTPPTPGASCTVTAQNRTAPLTADYDFTIFNIAGTGTVNALPPFRARVTCSDGTVGETESVFPIFNETILYSGGIRFGPLTPIPLALQVASSTTRLSTGQSTQISTRGISNTGQLFDLTPRVKGTGYTLSNPLLGSITGDGLYQVLAQFAAASSARVVVTAENEGVVGATMLTLGPRGKLQGKVMRADGSTPVAGAQISVFRTQPRENAGTATTDAAGNYQLDDVSAGTFVLVVIDPATGDRGQAASKIETEGEIGSVDVKLNGQGSVVVTVVDGNNLPVPNAPVTLTALGALVDTRTTNTDSAGKISFAAVIAGNVTLSTRDRASGLVGTILGFLPVSGTLNLTLKLQPVGTIRGVVYGVDGTTLQESVQVRILSRERGIVTQIVIGSDGAFSFDSLPLSDGPYTLDAFADGRLRARVPALILNSANQILTQNLQFVSSGIVTGLVSDSSGLTYPGATLTLQMTEGARYAFTAKADSQGRFYFGGIPVGNFSITAAKDTRTGFVLGRVSTDNENVTANVQIVTNSLIGTVFQRDGITPAAGATVYLIPSRTPLGLTINPALPTILRTISDGFGKFGFAIPGIDSYTIQAEFALDRGRTQVVIATIDPLRPVETKVTFLPKGTVTGVVRDALGTLQPFTTIDVTVAGAFNNTWSLTADSAGRFVVPDVFVGDIVATAKNENTKLAGSAKARLLSEGGSVSLDITLAATGTITGQVLRRDGSVVQGAVKLELSSQSGALPSQTIANGSSYKFDLVSLGDFTITATEVATGDKGIATSRLSVANETKPLNVRLIGLGSVRVKVVDDANLPISGAKITLDTNVPFQSTTTQQTGASGEVVFQSVFAGDFTVRASKDALIGSRSGSANATAIAGQERAVTVTLTNRPLGTVKGVLLAPNGVTPRAGVFIRMTPEPFVSAYITQTDSLGRYQFGNVEGGSTYTLTARFSDDGSCSRDRIRARESGVQITQQDEIVVRNLQLVGAGRVIGKITNALDQPVGGIRIRIVNPDPVYGANNNCVGVTSYDTFSASDGTYVFPDIPAGNFTITAENDVRTLRAEGAGLVRFDTDEVKLDLTVVDSAVTMPYTLHDANAMPFDIAGDGSVNSGKNNIFAGTGATNRGMRLDVVVAGVPAPFLNGNGSIGLLGLGGREIQVDEDNLASKLKITRKIFVPRTGYFVRYLEVLENKTTNPITVGLKVTTHHSESNSNPRIVDSSDGDQTLTITSGTTRDRWVVVDDQEDADPFLSGSEPATGHLFDGVGASKQADIATYDLVGQTGKLAVQWDNITVPAGKTVAVMHFAFNQLNRYDARQAALRLAQLPPEALEALTTDEREAILNFVPPANGISSVEPLPAINAGLIQGKVLSGDGITPVPGAQVHFKSKLPLFAKNFYTTADANGNFEFRARVNGTSNTLPVPLYSFDLDAAHPQTSAISANAVGDFVGTAVSAAKNIIFNGTGNLRGTVKRHTGGLVQDAELVFCTPSTTPCIRGIKSSVDGTYLLTGIPPATYAIEVTKTHPQQAGTGTQPIRGTVSATITAAETTVANITMEDTGTLSGIVRLGNGSPAENAYVELFYDPYYSQDAIVRVTRTDTAGRYRFFDVRTGLVRVQARDQSNGATGLNSSTVRVSEEATADINLKGFGTVNIQVNFARGVPAPNATFSYGNGLGGFDSVTGTGTADGIGKASFSGPVGSYQISASHPNGSNQVGASTATAILSSNGEVVNVTLALKAAGVVKGTILRPDGSTLAGGFPYTISLINGATSTQITSKNTSATGDYRAATLGVGLYQLTAFDAVQNRFADTEFEITADGQEVTRDLVLEENRIALPSDLYDANRFRFDIQQSGHLQTGHYWTFDQGGLKLEVNGQPFVGDTSATLEAGKRQFSITQPQSIDGLKVTRKIFIPRGAYFARYLEIFENPTAAPINLDAKVTSAYAAAQVISSSTGSNTLSPADQWAVLDDDINEDPFLATRQQPASAHVFANAGAGKTINEANLTTTTGPKSTLIQRWQQVVVPAGGKVALMHFVVQQVNRAGAIAAAQRLAQLPREAIQSLSSSEIQGIINFKLPQVGASVVEPLPALTGSIAGRVFEGDGRTAVSRVAVTVQSVHPLFNRVWGMIPYSEGCLPGTAEGSLISADFIPAGIAPPEGAYSLAGRLNDTSSIALPEGIEVRVVAQEPRPCFNSAIGHSLTRIPSREYRKVVPATLDVLFDSGILTGTISGYPDLQTTAGKVRLSTNSGAQVNSYVEIASDGAYIYPGLSAGTYDVFAEVPHPQGTGLRGSRIGNVITLGTSTVADVQLQPAGSITGAVLTANGEASVNARILLFSNATNQTYDQCASGCAANTPAEYKGKLAVTREVRTDSLGRYNFSAVPVGIYQITIFEPVTGAPASAELSVTEGQVVVKNLTQIGAVTIKVSAKYARGTPASAAGVYVSHSGLATETRVGTTDSSGQYNIVVPVGSYTIRVLHPLADVYDTRFLTTYAGAAVTNGTVVPIDVILKSVANIKAVVIDIDNSNATIANAEVSLTSGGKLLEGMTDASGAYIFANIPEGKYRMTTRLASGRTFGANGVVIIADDGQTVSKSIAVTANADALGELTFAGERRLYSVPIESGSLLNVSAFGEARGLFPALAVTRISVYDPSKSLLASGYQYPGATLAWYSTFNNQRNISATTAGNYTLAIESYTQTGNAALGAYRATAVADGLQLDIAPYEGGGSIEGIVLGGDGATGLANQIVSLKTLDALALNIRTKTDPTGKYRFENVPLSNFKLAVLIDGNEVASTPGALASTTSPLVQNLQLPYFAPITVLVQNVGANFGSSLPVTVSDGVGTRTFYTDSTYRVSFTGFGVVSVSAAGPNGETASTTVQLTSGQAQTIAVQFVLSTSIRFTVATPIGAAPVVRTTLVGKTSADSGCNSGGPVYGSVEKGVLETLVVTSDDVTNIVGFVACQDNIVVAESNVSPLPLQNNVVRLKTTALSVSVTDASNQVPPIRTELYIPNAYLGAIKRGEVEILLVDAIPISANPYQLRAFIGGQVADEQSLIISPEQLNLAQIKLSLIKGQAKFRDGTPVLDPLAYAFVVQGGVVGAVTGATVAGPNPGSFEIYGATVGELALFVQDPASSISAERSIQLPNKTAPLSVSDIIMPPTGTVTGLVKGSNGALLSNTVVFLSNSNVGRQAVTDGAGRYTFERVALGDFTVEVSPGSEDDSFDGFGNASGTISNENQIVDVSISLVARANISGRAVDGVDGLANALIQIEGVHLRQGALRSSSFYADAAGLFSAAAQPESIRVIVSEQYSTSRRGIALVNLTSSGATNLNVSIGNAVGFEYDFYTNRNIFSLRGDLYSAEGYNNDCTGTVSKVLSGGFNGVNMPCSRAAEINGDRDELTFGPFRYGDIEYSRRVYVPTTGTSFARVVDTLKNVGVNSQTPVYSLQNYALQNGAIDSQPTQILDRGNTYYDGLSYLQMVKHGVGKPVTYNTNALNMLSIPAGGSISVMSYLVARQSCNTNNESNSTCTIAEAGDVANALYNGTQPGMFKGLTVIDRANLINFNIPN